MKIATAATTALGHVRKQMHGYRLVTAGLAAAFLAACVGSAGSSALLDPAGSMTQQSAQRTSQDSAYFPLNQFRPPAPRISLRLAYPHHTRARPNANGNLDCASGIILTGYENTACGDLALQNGSNTGIGGTAVGYLALESNTSGSGNTASGAQALWSNTKGFYEAAFGFQALESNTIGTWNTAVGLAALQSNTTGSFNAGGGTAALEMNTQGSFNTAFGIAALQNDNYTGGPINASYNTAIGSEALGANTTGGWNTAIGGYALYYNTTADDNTATGLLALYSNTIGESNTASGAGALYSNTIGGWNTASGVSALDSNTTGSFNTATGMQALSAEATGSNNTANGYQALGNATGSGNIAIGFRAGRANTTGSNNIEIGNLGSGTDSNTIRIGTAQTATYIAGISGVNSGGVPVGINSAGLLGAPASSRRFKEDIADMGDATSGLMKLRPVTFHYKPKYDDGSRLLQYGLIAEEVAKVYPGLVAFSHEGQPWAVRYQFLVPMLLNEYQKQQRTIQDLRRELQIQTARINKMDEQTAEIEKLKQQVALLATALGHLDQVGIAHH